MRHVANTARLLVPSDGGVGEPTFEDLLVTMVPGAAEPDRVFIGLVTVGHENLALDLVTCGLLPGDPGTHETLIVLTTRDERFFVVVEHIDGKAVVVGVFEPEGPLGTPARVMDGVREAVIAAKAAA